VIDQMPIDLLNFRSGLTDHLKNSSQALTIKREGCLHEFMNQFARGRDGESLDLLQKLLDPRAMRIHGLELFLRVIGAGGPISLRQFPVRQRRLIRGGAHSAPVCQFRWRMNDSVGGLSRSWSSSNELNGFERT